MNRNILITGGAGFIGSHVVRLFVNKYPGYRIVNLDKLTYAGNLETLADVMENPNFRFVQGDIADAQAVERLFLQEKPDYVVNFAAESHVDRSITQPDLFLKTNVLGTGVLLDACRRHGVTRYHQVSTDEVYGDLPLDRPDLFFTEETPIHTSSPYSASKAGADLLVLAYARTYGLPVTVSRCSNNYGPYHFPEKLIPLMITRALADQSLPVYGTRLTCGLIKNKLEEFGLAGKTKFVEIVPRQKIKLGCFTVEPIHVNHSIPDAVAFAIDSPAGTIIQTGDFKIDYTPLACGVTDLSTLSEYGQRGVLALLSDSTNAERPGFTATEQKVAAGVRSLFARARNKRIIIATFASNIYRVQQIIDLAVEDGRKVAFSGRSMVNNTAMAQELGYMHIPEGTLISVDELNQYPPEQVVLVTTGSQGEPLSALSRMASCSHRQVRVGPGDFIIISANPIPGNEKSVTKIVNGLLLLGAEVIYESMYDVHVSGHACQEEQKLMLTLTKPKYFLPVHGEYKQLKKHALTAASLGIPTSNILIAENGSNVILSPDEMKLGEPVTAGAVMVDGLGVGDVGNVVLRDRKHLSEDGLVIIVATVDSKTGKVLAGPDLVSRGFVYVRENESLMDGAQSIVENALERCVDEHVRDWNSVKTRVREALSSYIYRRTKRSPMILPILMEV